MQIKGKGVFLLAEEEVGMRDEAHSSSMLALMPVRGRPLFSSWLLFPMDPRHSGKIQRPSPAQELPFSMQLFL